MQSYIDKGYVIISSENVTKRIKEVCPTAKVYDGSKEIPIKVMLESRKYLVDLWFWSKDIVNLIKDNPKNTVILFKPSVALLEEFEKQHLTKGLESEHIAKQGLHYIAEKDLMVYAMPVSGMPKEIKHKIANEIKEFSGVKNVLVVEGEFYCIPKEVDSLTSGKYVFFADSMEVAHHD